MAKADIHNQDKLFRGKFEEILEGIHPDDRGDVKRFCESAMMDGIGSARLLKYLFTLRPLSRELGRSFREAGEDDIRRLIFSIEMSDFSEWSKHDRKVILRKYLRFIGKDDLVKDLKIKPVKNNSKLPDEILTEDEIKAMAAAAYNSRDRAFILALYESGCRIGEFLPLKLKHLEFDEYGAVLHVRGKTGSRRVRLITSVPALQAWIGDQHPMKDDPDAYLWRKIPTPNNPKWKNEYLSYGFVARTLKQLAKKAGIKKRVNPHSFRHARATHLASHLTEAQMKEFFGWEQASEMAAVYVHLSGRDVDDALLAIHGIRDEKRNGTAFKPEPCPRCGEVNAPGMRFCKRCYLPLDGDYSREERLELALVRMLQELAEAQPEIKEMFHRAFKEVEGV
ncbi:MAG: integrase family protein [Candidatus Syntrophoarchaeum caldarius]|uniref:Integrase family protein n=1 Tax=Candidatus Syntropharchaeum caldarium TaxID=1838285 RepID=A0A1F2PBB0_9EURY|nr:MAG: integrase family protein [Candidatus Syntrophoarchaeum caldarius]